MVVVDMETFLTMPLPERGYILEPVVPTQGIVMLYAVRGIGKTYVASTIALAVASGGDVFGCWRAPAPKNVMYVDGEMPGHAMQTRFAALATGMAVPPWALNNLKIITPDLQQWPMPDLATRAGQSLIEAHLDDIDLIILDNLTTLCRTGRENERDSWQAVQEWLLNLRRRGKSMMLVHHAGKSGDQRGTSAHEDVVDTVIALRRPKDYKMAEGARFVVELTKARGIIGDNAEPFEAHLQGEDVLLWDVHVAENPELERFGTLLDEGKSIRQASAELGLSKSAGQRLKNKIQKTK